MGAGSKCALIGVLSQSNLEIKVNSVGALVRAPNLKITFNKVFVR